MSAQRVQSLVSASSAASGRRLAPGHLLGAKALAKDSDGGLLYRARVIDRA